MQKYTIFAGILVIAGTLQAGTSFQSTVTMTSNGGATVSAFPATAGQNSTSFAGVEISPYTGSVTTNGITQAITLFCTDFSDSINPGQAYTMNVTATNGTTTNALVNATAGSFANTHDGTVNESAGFPTGTTLYEEMAWLSTQMMASGQSINNEETIQEAIWEMTDDAATEHTQNDYSPTGNPTASGTYQGYQSWIWDAEVSVTGTCSGTGCSKTAGSYLTPNYSNWLILTVAGDAGKSDGLGGVQELLAYTGLTSTTTQSVAPEPASFILIGSSLLIGAGVGRRRMKNSKK